MTNGIMVSISTFLYFFLHVFYYEIRLKLGFLRGALRLDAHLIQTEGKDNYVYYSYLWSGLCINYKHLEPPMLDIELREIQRFQ
jgi:hypothetical protein